LHFLATVWNIREKVKMCAFIPFSLLLRRCECVVM
jgi:hypothetical protein